MGKRKASETRERPSGFEPWSVAAFFQGGLAAAALVLLGLEPGGSLPVLVYRWGLFGLAGVALLGLLAAIGWSLVHRPVLQRRRWVPLAVLAGTVWATSLPFPYPSSHDGHPSPTTFELPLDVGSSVVFAGERPERDPLALDPVRRFGVVLETPEPEGGVRSPAAGRVLACVPIEERFAPLGLAGVRVLVGVGEREVLVLEGLAPSAAPPAGSELRAGDVVGRLMGKRLGVFLADGTNLGRSEGIPMRFALPGAGRQPLAVGPIPALGEGRR
jgi:hypothetical protein